MAAYREASPDQAAFMAELVEGGLLIESGVPGVYGRSGAFESVREGVADAVTRVGVVDRPESLRFPPLLPRRQLESSGYLKSFPHLAGSVFAFEGTEAQAVEQHERASRHEDWREFQAPSDLVLMPAACYPVYPAIGKRGPLPPGGITVDAGGGYCFRHEPSGDPARLQMFHQREIVRLGEPEAVEAWRDAWRDRAVALLRSFGLDATPDVATDPFFGRSGRLMKAQQRQQALKWEIHVEITAPEPTAIASFNYHREHFAEAHGVTLASGEVAHTACLGFGLERVTLALLRTHGLDPSTWAVEVREPLGLG